MFVSRTHRFGCSAHLSRRLVVGHSVLMLLLYFAPAVSQAQTRSEFQAWNAVLGTATLDRQGRPVRPRLWLDIHGRRGETGTVLIFRPGFGLEIAEWLTVWAGYAWVPVIQDDDQGTTHEHRLWQQLTLKNKTDGLAVQSRTRFEQRFSDMGSDAGFRIRQFVRVNWQPEDDVPVGLAVWDEVFIGFNDVDWGPRSGFDQNRLFVGAFSKVQNWARFEVGYLFTYLDREPSRIAAHVLAANFFYKIKFD